MSRPELIRLVKKNAPIDFTALVEWHNVIQAAAAVGYEFTGRPGQPEGSSSSEQKGSILTRPVFSAWRFYANATLRR